MTPERTLSTLHLTIHDHEPLIRALLGAGTRFEGKLFFEGRARIDGAFDGEVFSEGMLIIGEQATVKGAIRVHTLIVRGGNIDGDIHATELVELHAPARVRGDIRTKALFMDKGVFFDGSCLMGEVHDLDDRPASRLSAEDTSPDGYKDQPKRS